MTKAPVEVVTSVERRRRWNVAEKEQLVAATLEPGASVSAVARTAGIHPSQLYGWRRQLCSRPNAAPAFAAVRVAAEPALMALPGAGLIEIEFAGGARMRITGAVDVAALSAAVSALAGGGRRR
jgi:transposase